MDKDIFSSIFQQEKKLMSKIPIPIPIFRAFLCSLAVGAFVAPAMADFNILENGTFETSDLTHWTDVPGSEGIFGVNGTAPYQGSYSAVFSSTMSPDAIYQEVDTIEGDKYRVVFWLQKELDGTNDFSVFWNNTLIRNWTNADPFTYAANGEVSITVYGGTGATSVLRFEGFTSEGAYRLDNVQVVPEPSTCALAVTAVAGLGAMARRRRRAGLAKRRQAALA